MRDALIGICNPLGKESFSLTALEFSSFGVPVSAGKDWGFFDTVINSKTGYLVSNERGLSKKIIFLYRREKVRVYIHDNGIEHSNSFSPMFVINQWVEELNMILSNKKRRNQLLTKNIFHRKNWLKEIFRILKVQKLIKFPLVLDKSYVKVGKEFIKLNFNK
jgi:glycosyltransferase involved in cell wall biosynthesis